MKKTLTVAILINVLVLAQANANCSMSTIEIAKCTFGKAPYVNTVTLTNNSGCGFDSILHQFSGLEEKTNGSVDHGTHTVYRFETLRLAISNKSLEHLEKGTTQSLRMSRNAKVYQTLPGTKTLVSLGTVTCDAISAN